MTGGGLDRLFGVGMKFSGINAFSGPAKTVMGSLNSVMKGFGNADKMLMKFSAGALVGGAVLTGLAIKAVKATAETKTALGELASVGVKDLKTVEKAGQDFSNKWSGSTKADFIRAAYDIKSGISSLSDEGVADYTRIAALTAKATKATVGDMTSLFATGYGIYKNYYGDMTDMKFAELFSGGIASAVQMFKTTGPEMAAGISSLGASATTANIPLEEQLAILGMLQATMSGAEAGTKYQAFLKSVVKGGEKIGLQFTDANNQLLSMPDILDTIRNKYGDTVDAVERYELQKAFGRIESLQAIELLITKTGDLRENIDIMSSSMETGTEKAYGMAKAMDEGPAESWGRMRQAGHNLLETIGNIIEPDVTEGLDKVHKGLVKIQEDLDKNPEKAEWIGKGLLYGGGGLMGLGALGLLKSIGGWGFSKIAGGIGLITTAVKGLVTVLTTLASSGGLVALSGILSLGLIGYAGWETYKKRDIIKEMITGFFSGEYLYKQLGIPGLSHIPMQDMDTPRNKLRAQKAAGYSMVDRYEQLGLPVMSYYPSGNNIPEVPVPPIPQFNPNTPEMRPSRPMLVIEQINITGDSVSEDQVREVFENVLDEMVTEN